MTLPLVGLLLDNKIIILILIPYILLCYIKIIRHIGCVTEDLLMQGDNLMDSPNIYNVEENNFLAMGIFHIE